MALAIIMILYVSIGALSAVGSMYLSHRFVPARFESSVYGLFLIPIAAFYLVFTSYFGDAAAGVSKWRR
jgi:MFS-type transporter involved in bile tolerance (Atg22 family)